MFVWISSWKEFFDLGTDDLNSQCDENCWTKPRHWFSLTIASRSVFPSTNSLYTIGETKTVCTVCLALSGLCFCEAQSIVSNPRIYTQLRSIEWESVLTFTDHLLSFYVYATSTQQWSLHRFPPYIWCRCRWCCVCYSICG